MKCLYFELLVAGTMAIGIFCLIVIGLMLASLHSLDYGDESKHCYKNELRIMVLPNPALGGLSTPHYIPGRVEIECDKNKTERVSMTDGA